MSYTRDTSFSMIYILLASKIDKRKPAEENNVCYLWLRQNLPLKQYKNKGRQWGESKLSEQKYRNQLPFPALSYTRRGAVKHSITTGAHYNAPSLGEFRESKVKQNSETSVLPWFPYLLTTKDKNDNKIFLGLRGELGFLFVWMWDLATPG